MSETKNILGNKFLFSHNGDSSVGIPREAVIIEYDGKFSDPEYQKDFIAAIGGALTSFFGSKITIVIEHEHICAGCGAVVKHLDDYCDLPFFCDAKECLVAQIERDVTEQLEQTEAREAAWNELSEEDRQDIINGALWIDGEDYIRDRNTRIENSINGAGVRQ